MWILKKINVGTNLVPTLQPNGVDSAPVATTRRAQREAEQAARSYLRYVAAHSTNPRVERQQAILNIAQPGEAIRRGSFNLGQGPDVCDRSIRQPSAAPTRRRRRRHSDPFSRLCHRGTLRVPVRTGSIVELTTRVSTPTSASEINDAFAAAASEGPLAGILGVLLDEWASARIVGETRSSIVDLPLTSVSDGDLVTVAARYDNEFGYATRLAETAAVLADG